MYFLNNGGHHVCLFLADGPRQVEERLDTYTSAYDVVILGDGNFDFVLQLLEHVAPKRQG